LLALSVEWQCRPQGDGPRRHSADGAGDEGLEAVLG
jgi:hypothetical protein